MKKKKTYLVLGLLFVVLPVRAQNGENCFIPSSFSRRGTTVNLGLIGTCFDSYLSPNGYSGLSLSVLAEDWSLSKWGNGRLFAQHLYDTSVGFTVFGQGAMLSAMENYSWALPWQLAQAGGFRFYAGPELQARLGVIYNMRNSNNPANIKAALHAAGMGRVEVVTNIIDRPAMFSYQLDLPLVGTFFAPQYTQSLYEIFYMDSHAPVVHFASPFNCLASRHIFSLDVQFRHSTLRATLMNDAYQWRTSTAAYALRSWQFGIGYVLNFYTVRPYEKATEYLPY